MNVNAADFFTQQEKEDIKLAIKNAELDTSGEIRVHIENVCSGEVLDRAAYIFDKLGMINTQEHNGVLFYLAIRNRKFAVIGDSEINKNVPEDFWNRLKMNMLAHFRENRFSQGLCEAIEETGAYLKKYFSHQQNDVNELSDEISFGKGK